MAYILNRCLDRFVYPSPTDKTRVTTYDFNGIQCLYRPHESSCKYIVYAHGNLMTLQSVYESGIADAIGASCSANVIVPEYAGYGDLENCNRGVGPDADNLLYNDVKKVLEYLESRNVTRVYLVGRSLGTGVVMGTLSTYPKMCDMVEGVSLISPFKSLNSLCPRMIQCIVPSRMPSDRYIKTVASNVRMMLIHGTVDELITPDHSEALAAAANANVQVELIPGMSHAINHRDIQQICTRLAKFTFAQDTERHAISPDVFQSK